MRKLLLSSVAAIAAISASPAHADAKLPHTDPLIGGWCEDPNTDLRPGKPIWYKRGSNCGLDIDRDGILYTEYGCAFLEIKRTPNGVEVITECAVEENSYVHSKITLHIINKKLRFQEKVLSDIDRRMEAPLCIKVEPTPDGYLNLREGPGMAYKVRGKLLIGDEFRIDAKNSEWSHVSEALRNPEDKIGGWIYSKYTKKIDCDSRKEITENPPKPTILPDLPPPTEPAAPKPTPGYDVWVPRDPPKPIPSGWTPVTPAELPKEFVGDWCPVVYYDEKELRYDLREECFKPDQLYVRRGRYSATINDCTIRKVDRYRVDQFKDYIDQSKVDQFRDLYRLESWCKGIAPNSWTETSSFQIKDKELVVIVFEKK